MIGGRDDTFPAEIGALAPRDTGIATVSDYADHDRRFGGAGHLERQYFSQQAHEGDGIFFGLALEVGGTPDFVEGRQDGRLNVGRDFVWSALT